MVYQPKPIVRWKEELAEIIRLKYGDEYEIDNVELNRQLDDIIAKYFKDIKCTLHNNYNHFDQRNTMMNIIDRLMNGKAILGGDACIFAKHEDNLSINFPIISNLKSKRNEAKAARKKYDEGEDGYIYYNNRQKNTKVIINSLYGVTGYPRFQFYNVHLAQSVTAIGQAIISTAACGYENFMANNIKFVNIAEVLHYITTCIEDYKRDYPEAMDLFDEIEDVEVSKLTILLRNKSAFEYTQYESDILSSILRNLDHNVVKLIYYKNNVMGFNKTSYMMNLLKNLFDNIDTLLLGDIYAFDNPEGTGSVMTEDAPKYMDKVVRAYRVFVQYNHQTFDRVRRTRYTDKKAVLYIDTDSNFLALDPYVRFVFEEIYHGECDDYNKMRFKVSSIFTMIHNDVVARNFVDFTRSLNISPEYGKILGMKNEFFFTRMAFATVKKRYYGWKMLQEGVLIKNGVGSLVIAGFDFIKAGTKDTIRDKYEEIINKILSADHINIADIIREAINFKRQIEEEIKAGDSKYFKQATASVLERYANPYSQQSIKGVLLWNAIAGPSHRALDLPVEVDIIPIKLANGYTKIRIQKIAAFGPNPDFNDPNVLKIFSAMPELQSFAQSYPDHYALLHKNILMSEIEGIRNMEFKDIAKPRDLIITKSDQWLKDIIDVDKIITDTVSLLTPVLEATGVKTVTVGAKKISHYTNIVEI